MQNKKKLKKIHHPYLFPFIIIFFTVIGLFIYFAIEEYEHNRSKLHTALSSEAERIDHSLNDIIDHTAFIMKIILMQIKPNYEDKEYIYNIIDKYAVKPNLNNILSWTSFSWVDKDHQKIVDSVMGANTMVKNEGDKNYIRKTKIYPDRLHLGEPVYGFTSQRYFIPAGIGAYNADKYIGALTIGFDLFQLSKALADSIKDQAVYFALLDKNFNIITQSPSNLREIKKNPIKNDDIKKFVYQKNINFKELNSISQINLIKDGTNHYLYKIRDYPYALYLRYDNKFVRNIFWKDITFRIVEIIVMGFVAFLIVIIIYKRESQLREQAEIAQKEAEDASKAKTNFLAYTAHELRSPLAYIISSSEIILAQLFGKIPKKYAEYIRTIHQSGKDLLEFIDDLLNEVQAKEGKFHIEMIYVDVKEMIIRSIKINNVNYNNKVKIEIGDIENLPQLYTDPKRLLQVFNNIISNAIKYSPENSILNIYTELNKKGLNICFNDHGFGMSEEELSLSRIKFGVVNHKKKNKYNSIGLGLPLVIELVEILGGQFSINSKVGVGTNVEIFFPQKLLKKNE